METSAAAKLLKREPESAVVREFIAQLIDDEHLVVTGRMLETELRRLAVRKGIDQEKASEILDLLDVLEHDRSQFRQAGTIGGDQVRSLDALHLAAALRVGADALITFDERLKRACELVGLPVLSVTGA
ncbi:MAG: PIN domain-containing protein [Actinobacteria bacterium]|nr:PIN domain-containing protein [Actinomycetota bacterium]